MYYYVVRYHTLRHVERGRCLPYPVGVPASHVVPGALHAGPADNHACSQLPVCRGPGRAGVRKEL